MLLCTSAGSHEQSKSWQQLSPDGVEISEGGWLEHHVRKMCGALQSEASRWPNHPQSDAYAESSTLLRSQSFGQLDQWSGIRPLQL
jgi:hypothetical protein